ncbi:MAG: hypothetical protein JNL11_06695 [Bdellovibrionaceae bacterium]|nr:hypothetical protein [Pseudobdellovibrionaceae bacterium]
MFKISLRGRVLIFIFFLALTTMAEVKKEFGEFVVTHVDTLKNQKVVQRHYSSRSLFKGLFGFNWCSTLDYRLTIEDSIITVFDCELGRTLSFKKSKSGVFQNTRLQLEITEKKQQWQWIRPPNTYVFSQEGRLNYWIDHDNNIVYIDYRDRLPHRLLSKKTGPLVIESTSSGVIKKIGPTLIYEYSQNLLNKVINKKKRTWQYQYDEFLNMTLWRGPSSYESMKYDSEWDRIIFLKDQRDCRFRYQYEIKKNKKFIVESKKCLNAAEHETLFEVTPPRPIIKTLNDQLGNEFRQGAHHEDVY